MTEVINGTELIQKKIEPKRLSFVSKLGQQTEIRVVDFVF